VIYQGSASGSIFAGESKPLTSFQVPSQAANGKTILGIHVRNGATSKLSSLYKTFDIDGIASTLQAITSKETYMNTEAITGISTLTTGQFGIDNGNMRVNVTNTQEGGTGNFSLFLPKGWSRLFSPQGLAMGADGTVFVADSNIIWKFDSDGNALTNWGVRVAMTVSLIILTA